MFDVAMKRKNPNISAENQAPDIQPRACNTLDHIAMVL
jgi:hypothetical protein